VGLSGRFQLYPREVQMHPMEFRSISAICVRKLALFWLKFHENIIKSYFHKVVIIKFSFGEHVCGYLYNFKDFNGMYAIQSGFNYSSDKLNRPGLVSHFLAICYAIENKCKSYDFLSGDAQYKRSLSNAQKNQSWLTIKNNTIQLVIEGYMLKWYRKIRKIITRG